MALRATLTVLELHGGKTRLIEFGRYARERRAKQGKFRVLRRRLAKLKTLGEEMKFHRHEPIKAQGAWLGAVLRGYYGYYAVPGNIE